MKNLVTNSLHPTRCPTWLFFCTGTSCSAISRVLTSRTLSRTDTRWLNWEIVLARCLLSVPHGHALPQRGTGSNSRVTQLPLLAGLRSAPAHPSPRPRLGVAVPRRLSRGGRGGWRRAVPSPGAAGGRPRPPRAGRGGRARARGEEGSAEGSGPARTAP